MRKLAILALLFAPIAQADTIKVVAQEIKQDSVLPMNASISVQLATNLLAAQAALPQLDSLDLSINAVLKAITFYDFPGGPQQLSTACCPAVWAQSTIAIDPNAGGVITPGALNFGEVAVSTPEPSIIVLLLVGLALASLLKVSSHQLELDFSNRKEKGAGSHPAEREPLRLRVVSENAGRAKPPRESSSFDLRRAAHGGNYQ